MRNAGLKPAPASAFGSSSAPSTTSRPRHAVVIYDSQCAFCRGWVERLRRWDRRKRLSFLSLHDPEVERRFPGLAKDELMRELHVVDRRGRRYGGARAMRYLSLRLPSLWWLAPLLHVPFSLALWNWLYRKIAGHRYGLSSAGPCAGGRSTTCEGPIDG